MSVKIVSPKLFFCQTCSQNLELKTKDEFEQHASECTSRQMLENDETIEEPAPQAVSDLGRKEMEIVAQAYDTAEVSDKSQDVDIIKCDRCEFKLGCKYPSSGYSPSLRQNLRVNMTQHYDEVHNIKDMKICKSQGCHFRTQSNPLMRNHVRGKAGRAQCEICGKSISSMNIHSHMKTHSDHTIDCEYCFRPYAGNGMLK